MGIGISIFLTFVLSGFALVSQIKNWLSEKELVERRAGMERFRRHMERGLEDAQDSMKKTRTIRNMAEAKTRLKRPD